MIGHSPKNYWNYEPITGQIDLSRGAKDKTLDLQTTTNPIRLDTNRTALVIIDMQNLFLSPHLRPAGIPKDEISPGQRAAKALIDDGLSAARSAGIQVIWLSWGLTEEDLETMPPGVMRAFGIYPTKTPPTTDPSVIEPEPAHMLRTRNPNIYKGPGEPLGPITLDNEIVDGGRMLMQDSWSCALYPPLEKEFLKGSTPSPDHPDAKKDILINKNRMSGLWGSDQELERFLEAEGIASLLFAGVNLDQCVGGTLVDAFNKGYDCILLRDASGTSSPGFSEKGWHYNIQHCWGFVTTCKALKEAKCCP
ncbi:hypothetical protein N7456_013641 [Penicillium angulare]|uniref:Isochorismatase-like domain-containing protein n=1 Tax=Penicillium angulare TaxID=116970 RepID=A0A9W9EFQ5_9EURO|nr:hypothetical protein N7456_013641 [Penicillium angulare]